MKHPYTTSTTILACRILLAYTDPELEFDDAITQAIDESLPDATHEERVALMTCVNDELIDVSDDLMSNPYGKPTEQDVANEYLERKQ